jgi:predicted nucleic acid-binding protein
MGELAEGFARPHDLAHLIQNVKILSLPKQVAWEASRIAREISGRRLGENDNWIAATARAWGLRLVTRDLAFARVPKLNVVRY